jgi:phosphate-selective porin OprO/OprP
MIYKLHMQGMCLSGLLLVSAPALAAAKAPPPDPRIGFLEQELRDVQQQLAEIKSQHNNSSANSSALEELKRNTSAQYADTRKRLDNQTKVGLDNGRLTFVSANGDFSLSLRSLVQFDAGYFSQGKNPPVVDLNSGTNFRRAQFGFVGTAWRDWSYNFTYDFGGNGIEKNGYIYTASLEYDGFKPFGVRIGAFAPPAGLDDSTGSGDLFFLERASASDIARNIAGAPSREGINAFVQGGNYFFSISYTGKKATDAATFDAQQAVVTRASWLAVNHDDLKLLLDADVTHVFKLADAAANTNTSNFFSFSNGTEVAIDGSKTVNTGNIDANQVTEFGLEMAAAYAGLYGQGGWFHYDITRRTALPNPTFSGWYALATYSLTGEEHQYDPTTASFRGLKPNNSLGSPGGWGAWEVSARYSNIDLDYNPLLAASLGGVAGGVQNIWTLGLNWYPTSGLRFILNYDNIQVDHVGAQANNISANAFALRSQISF